jgi:integrase/recombinase XerD
MIENATNLRDKAFISTLYESGCRIGELLPIKLRSVVFDEYGAVLIVDGKTGMRRIRLISSVPLLANWISNHPFKNNPDAFL